MKWGSPDAPRGDVRGAARPRAARERSLANSPGDMPFRWYAWRCDPEEEGIMAPCFGHVSAKAIQFARDR